MDDKQTLDPGTGLAWNAVSYASLTAQAASDSPVAVRTFVTSEIAKKIVSLHECFNCWWWEEDVNPGLPGWGTCTRDAEPNALFNPRDGEGLDTNYNFGCVQFEPKKFAEKPV